jgi:hypothetical protein
MRGFLAGETGFPPDTAIMVIVCSDDYTRRFWMEFCVGLMLILSGVLNLTGFLHWITNNVAPAQGGHSHRSTVHSDAHNHGDHVHTYPHKHDPKE